MKDLLIVLALLTPYTGETSVTLFGGREYRVWNLEGFGIQGTVWPETHQVIVTLGYRGKWLGQFRAW
jgi:hypothetical protein